MPNAKPDARAKNYLAIVRVCNYCNTKTTDLQAKHKYTTKADLCIHVQTSDHCVTPNGQNGCINGTTNNKPEVT